jgi:hypothetical protein
MGDIRISHRILIGYREEDNMEINISCEYRLWMIIP